MDSFNWFYQWAPWTIINSTHKKTNKTKIVTMTQVLDKLSEKQNKNYVELKKQSLLKQHYPNTPITFQTLDKPLTILNGCILTNISDYLFVTTKYSNTKLYNCTLTEALSLNQLNQILNTAKGFNSLEIYSKYYSGYYNKLLEQYIRDIDYASLIDNFVNLFKASHILLPMDLNIVLYTAAFIIPYHKMIEIDKFKITNLITTLLIVPLKYSLEMMVIFEEIQKIRTNDTKGDTCNKYYKYYKLIIEFWNDLLFHNQGFPYEEALLLLHKKNFDLPDHLRQIQCNICLLNNSQCCCTIKDLESRILNNYLYNELDNKLLKIISYFTNKESKTVGFLCFLIFVKKFHSSLDNVIVILNILNSLARAETFFTYKSVYCKYVSMHIETLKKSKIFNIHEAIFNTLLEMYQSIYFKPTIACLYGVNEENILRICNYLIDFVHKKVMNTNKHYYLEFKNKDISYFKNKPFSTFTFLHYNNDLTNKYISKILLSRTQKRIRKYFRLNNNTRLIQSQP
jgi:hypothetical protein